MESIQQNLNHARAMNSGIPDATHPQRRVHPESINVTLFGQCL